MPAGSRGNQMTTGLHKPGNDASGGSTGAGPQRRPQGGTATGAGATGGRSTGRPTPSNQGGGVGPRYRPAQGSGGGARRLPPTTGAGNLPRQAIPPNQVPPRRQGPKTAPGQRPAQRPAQGAGPAITPQRQTPGQQRRGRGGGRRRPHPGNVAARGSRASRNAARNRGQRRAMQRMKAQGRRPPEDQAFTNR